MIGNVKHATYLWCWGLFIIVFTNSIMDNNGYTKNIGIVNIRHIHNGE